MNKNPQYLTLAELNEALPKSTAAKYRIVNMEKRTSLKFFSAKHGEIDLRTLTVQKAEQLVKNKASFIEVVEKKSKEPKLD
jgi:hypothetical protein